MKSKVLLYPFFAFLCLVGCRDQKRSAPNESQNKMEAPEGEESPDGMEKVADGLEKLPIFPIPYPRPSSIDVLPKYIINNYKTLGEVDDVLSMALESCQYYRKSYFHIPEGFALVTQLEQINIDGTSKSEKERWIYDGYTTPVFSIGDYIRRLFQAQPGYYRSIVFLVSNNSFTSSKESLSREKAYDWLDEGGSKLPSYVRKKSIDSEYSITALIYEFRKFENSQKAELLYPSEIQGRIHLEKSNILGYLQ